MDVTAARELASRLATWPGEADRVIGVISEAELLSDLSIAGSPALDSIGRDGRSMAASIRQAADALESFSISLDSPLAIADAVRAVRSFVGTDNDPELDARLGTLRLLVEAHTDSDAEAARVMAGLLAADQSIDVRFRDTTAIATARSELDRLSRLAGSGAISDNDPRIDDAGAALFAALAEHASDPAQAVRLMADFVADENRVVATSTLLGAALTGHSRDVVERAHREHVDYEIASGMIKLDEVDALTALLRDAPPEAAGMLLTQRRSLLIELDETLDRSDLASLTEQLTAGVPAIDAFAGLDVHVLERAHRHQVQAVAGAFGLSDDEAETALAEMTDDTTSLVERGWSSDDAAAGVVTAAHADLDVDSIEAAALERGLTMREAADRMVVADALGLSLDELAAYEGFRDHFPELDIARGGMPDGIVSVFDLVHVVNHPEEFSAELVVVAAGVLGSAGLRNRLDDARDNDDVVGHESFGSDDAADHRWSLEDFNAFEFKQSVNFVLADHVDAIDVVNQGGDRGEIDGQLRKHDFEAYLARADEFGLSDEARAAIQTVIEADWYDKDFWDEHGDTMAFAAGVVAGSAVVFLTAGTATGLVVVTLSAAAAGTAAGAGYTIAENALSGDDLTEGLLTNSIAGASGGLFVAGLAGGGSSSLAGRVLAHSSNAGALVSNGVADPVLEKYLEDDTIEDLHTVGRTVNYLAGSASVSLQTVSAVGGIRAVDGSMRLVTDDGLRFLDDVLDDIAVDGLQRMTGAGLDTGAELALPNTAPWRSHEDTASG